MNKSKSPLTTVNVNRFRLIQINYIHSISNNFTLRFLGVQKNETEKIFFMCYFAADN